MPAENREMETRVGFMLQYGVTLAALIVLAGGLLYFHRAAHQPLPDYSHFPSVRSPLTSFQHEWRALRTGDPDAIIGVGLLVLILTPMARVAICIFGFVKERNWLYVLVSSTVMAVLVYSILHVH